MSSPKRARVDEDEDEEEDEDDIPSRTRMNFFRHNECSEEERDERLEKLGGVEVEKMGEILRE